MTTSTLVRADRREMEKNTRLLRKALREHGRHAATRLLCDARLGTAGCGRGSKAGRQHAEGHEMDSRRPARTGDQAHRGRRTRLKAAPGKNWHHVLPLSNTQGATLTAPAAARVSNSSPARGCRRSASAYAPRPPSATTSAS